MRNTGKVTPATPAQGERGRRPCYTHSVRGFLAECRKQLFLARNQGSAQSSGVELGFLDLGEHLPFFFLDVVVDVLAEHLHSRVEVVIFRR